MSNKLTTVFVLLLLVSLSPNALKGVKSSEVHDVAVTNVTTWSKWASPYIASAIVYINATVENQGTTYETFNLTIYANNNTVQAIVITDLAPGLNETITFEWEIYPARGIIFPPPWPLHDPMVKNLRIQAEADIVAGEADTSDNIYIDGEITIIWWVIDINGDGKIDGKDIAIMAKAFGSLPGDPRWNPWVDFDQDGKIDGREIAYLAKCFGARYA